MHVVKNTFRDDFSRFTKLKCLDWTFNGRGFKAPNNLRFWQKFVAKNLTKTYYSLQNKIINSTLGLSLP